MVLLRGRLVERLPRSPPPPPLFDEWYCARCQRGGCCGEIHVLQVWALENGLRSHLGEFPVSMTRKG